MTLSRMRYSEFADRLDVDAVEDALGFNKIQEDGHGNDVGYCFDLYGLHKNGDTTGKLAIHREKMVFNCFVCGGGSLLSLAMEIKDLDIEDATEWLYQFTQEDLRTDSEFVDEFMSHFDPPSKISVTMPFFNEKVLDKFSGEYSQEWAPDRGISQVIWKEFGLKYNAETRRRAPKKFEGESDYFGPSIILPHFFKGRLVGWQSRWLSADRPKWVPKYTMTSDFPKNETLYNFDRAWASKNPVVVVESVPTVLFLESLGVPAVGTFGSSVSEAQIKLLRGINEIILARDLDSAGEKWERDLLRPLDSYTNVYLANYSAYKEDLPLAFDMGDLGSLSPCDAVDAVFDILNVGPRVTDNLLKSID